MFILTAKIAKEKIIIGVLALAAVVVLLVLFFGGGGSTESAEAISPTNISSNDDRLGYIQSFGWEVDVTPLETMEVTIPKEGDKVFDRYNELQKSQGFDLDKFSGKKVKKISYQVLNHPSGEEDVVLTLFTFKKEIIGGDVSSGKEGGFMHSFQMPDFSDVTAEEAEATATEEVS